MSQEYFEKYQVGSPAVVQIDNVSGSITVRPGPEGEVTIQAVQHGRDDDRTRVEIGKNEDGSVFARSESRKSSFRFMNFMGDSQKVDFTVTVPAASSLTVRAVNASTDVSGVSGQLNLKTVNGALKISEVTGEMMFKTVNGDITGSHVSGSAELKTVSGAISLEQADLPSLTATTVSGDILLDTPVGDGPYHLKTVSGTIQLVSKSEINGRIHSKTVSGAVRLNGQDLTTRGYGPGKRTIALGSGGPDIHFKSVSGNLEVKADSYVETEVMPESLDHQAEPAPDMMAVLDRISRGEMTVDEGIAKIQH